MINQIENASLIYEILVYLNSFYFGMLAFVQYSVFVFKVVKLGEKYTEFYTYRDGGILLLTTVLEVLRIYLGRKSTLSRHGWQVIISVVLIIPCILCMTFLIFWQNKIIHLERILCALELMLHAGQLFYAMLFTYSACRPHPYT